MKGLFQEAWASALAFVLYGISFVLMLFGGVMVWMSAKDVAGGERVVVNLVVVVVGLSIVGVGVIIGRTALRIIRFLSGTDAPPPPPTP
jgi:hypothetical protein